MIIDDRAYNHIPRSQVITGWLYKGTNGVQWNVIVSYVSEEEVLEFVRSRLASYKVPKSVVFLENLPKTGANKVDKKALEQLYGVSETRQ